MFSVLENSPPTPRNPKRIRIPVRLLYPNKYESEIDGGTETSCGKKKTEHRAAIVAMTHTVIIHR